MSRTTTASGLPVPRPAASIEKRPSAAPQDKADRVICVFASASPSSPRRRPARAGSIAEKFHNGAYTYKAKQCVEQRVSFDYHAASRPLRRLNRGQTSQDHNPWAKPIRRTPALPLRRRQPPPTIVIQLENPGRYILEIFVPINLPPKPTSRQTTAPPWLIEIEHQTTNLGVGSSNLSGRGSNSLIST